MLKPYQIRLDDELLNDIKASAKNEERSVNAQIRFLIKKGLKNIKK